MPRRQAIKNVLPYYKAYPRDFIEGTIGMPFEIKGCYRIIIDLIYMQSGNLPDDARYISGILGCSIRKWKNIRKFLIEADKLSVNGDFLTNHRVVLELESLAKLQDKQRQNRSGPNKNKGLATPKLDHPEPEPEPYRKALSKDSTQKPKKGNGNGHRIETEFKENWNLPDKYYAYGKSKGLADEEINFEFERFTNYWKAKSGKDATKRDWLATWRSWILNAAKWSGNNGGPTNGGSKGGGTPLFELATELLDEIGDGVP